MNKYVREVEATPLVLVTDLGGDTVHVGVIVKQRDWNGSFDGLPLETEVIDAREQAVAVKLIALPGSGFVEWTYDNAHESSAGGSNRTILP